MAKDGKIVFAVTPAEGYEVTSILVDGTIPARTNDETPETNDYIIEGIQTDSTVVVISTQAAVVESETESETATEAATEVESESESETEAVTESESETVVETESETETIAETETESEAVTEAETEIETAAETETAVETESETEAVIETEAKSRKRKAKAKAKAAAQAGEGENGIAVPNGSVDLTDFLTSATIMTSDGKPYKPAIPCQTTAVHLICNLQRVERISFLYTIQKQGRRLWFIRCQKVLRNWIHLRITS